LLVFALTGTTVLLLKRPLFRALPEVIMSNSWFHVAYFILILPIYNIILLLYGALFGQFDFFWEFEKRMFQKLFGKSS